MRIKLDDGAIKPSRAHKEDAGADLYTPERVVLRAHDSVTIDTGVHFEIPRGWAGFLKSKSGLNVNHDIISDGTIDSGYTGSVKVKLYNLGGKMHIFEAGDKITQIVFERVECCDFEVVDEIESGERGNNGFGSSGV